MDIFIAKLYNKAFNNKLSVFLYLLILSTIFSAILFPITKDFFGFLLNLVVIAIILAVTTVRLSKVVVYSKITKHLSMNLLSLDYGTDFNYDKKEERDSLGEIFKEDFIQGIEYAHKKGYKTIKMTTHKWVVENIVKNNRVQNLYHISIEEHGECDTKLETILLAGKDTERKNFKKKCYKVILKRR